MVKFVGMRASGVLWGEKAFGHAFDAANSAFSALSKIRRPLCVGSTRRRALQRAAVPIGVHFVLNRPIVGMDATPDGQGYWLVASDGGIFAFGDAGFYGSTGGQHISAPIAGIQASSTGNGYWMVAKDGGIFAFGDARYFGSAGNLDLQSPTVSIS